MAKEIQEQFSEQIGNGYFSIVARNNKIHYFRAANTSPSTQSDVCLTVEELEQLESFIRGIVNKIKIDKDFS